MRGFFDRLVEASERRLRSARDQADVVRHDKATHRLLMQSVFVLEDTHFLLRQIAEQHGSEPVAPSPTKALVERRS